MNGRGGAIKLVSKLRKDRFQETQAKKIEAFLHLYFSETMGAAQHSVASFTRQLLRIAYRCDIRISLDYDVKSNHFFPILAVEVELPKGTSYADSPDVEDVIDLFRLDRDLLEGFYELHRELPSGIKIRSIYHQLLVCVSTHIKLSLTPRGGFIKSYLGVHGRRSSDSPIVGIAPLV
jgi:hypothetical protein